MIDKFKNKIDLNLEKITIEWTIGDVFDINESLTRQEAMEILRRAKEKYDANIGLNYDILETYVDDIIDERIEDKNEENREA